MVKLGGLSPYRGDTFARQDNQKPQLCKNPGSAEKEEGRMG